MQRSPRFPVFDGTSPGERRVSARKAALDAHDRACDRIIFLAIKRREAERELREYEAGAHYPYGAPARLAWVNR